MLHAMEFARAELLSVTLGSTSGVFLSNPVCLPCFHPPGSGSWQRLVRHKPFGQSVTVGHDVDSRWVVFPHVFSMSFLHSPGVKKNYFMTVKTT